MRMQTLMLAAVALAARGPAVSTTAADAAMGGATQPAMYGPGGGGWGLANTAIRAEVTFSQTFIPTTTAGLTSFCPYLMNGETGYAAGSGGRLHFEVQTEGDDGFASGVQVGTGFAEAVHHNDKSLFPLLTFTSPIPVQAGTRYHLVVSNTDPDPAQNFVSMNSIYQGTGPLLHNTVNVKFGDGPWRRRGDDGFYYVPIGEYRYDTGAVDGFGYIHAMPHEQHKQEISRGRAVRQLMKVSGGDKPVGELHYYAEHVEGTGVITAVLRSGASEVKRVATHVTEADARNGQWFTFPFDVTLMDGISYELEFLVEGDSRYNGLIFRRGVSHGFSARSEFGDGYAQFSETPGQWLNWRIWGNSSTQGDLMFYFDLRSDGVGSAVESRSWGRLKRSGAGPTVR